MRKKITIVTMTTGFGGIERFVATLSGMFAEDYEVEIIATYGKKGKEAFVYPKNVKVRHLVANVPEMISAKNLLKKCDAIGLVKEVPRRIKINYTKWLLNRKVLRELDTDIIITERSYYSKLVGKYCRQDGIIKIATDHNFHQENKKYIKSLINSVKGFDYLVVATRELYDFYKTRIGGVKCVLIPNPLPEMPKKKVSLREKNLVAVGRFAPEKGFDDLIRVFELVHKQLPDTKLFLVGDGLEKQRIQKLANDSVARKRIIMPGFLKQSEIEKYYYESSVYVMTSHTEAFGLVLAEAMSYGLPCVAFDSASGARELLSKTGILVKSRDCAKMADKIVELLQDDKKRKMLGESAFVKAKEFAPEKIMRLWRDIL
ncbi:glycosyltransferase [Candidatus Saccharibacteria bacterium]|nr:glycosyltransferase [Candidatus Saccharibacteria bacterium]